MMFTDPQKPKRESSRISIRNTNGMKVWNQAFLTSVWFRSHGSARTRYYTIRLLLSGMSGIPWERKWVVSDLSECAPLATMPHWVLGSYGMKWRLMILLPGAHISYLQSFRSYQDVFHTHGGQADHLESQYELRMGSRTSYLHYIFLVDELVSNQGILSAILKEDCFGTCTICLVRSRKQGSGMCKTPDILYSTFGLARERLSANQPPIISRFTATFQSGLWLLR